jgi:hypothetical protein
MNKARNLVEMGEFYASTILNEKKNTFPGSNTFEVQKDKKVIEPKLKEILPKHSGPDHKGAETMFKAGVKKATKEGEELSVYSDERFTEENPEYIASKKNIKKKGKKVNENINNFMTKSIFDKLYETVMNEETPGHDMESHDVEALDLPVGDEGEVTITLDRAMAKKLHDVLMACLGEEDHSEEEVESEEESEEDTVDEATELEEVPDSRGQDLAKVAKNSNTVKSSWSTHNVDGEEGDIDGESVVNEPEPKVIKAKGADAVTGKANVVDGRSTKNVGKVAFTK